MKHSLGHIWLIHAQVINSDVTTNIPLLGLMVLVVVELSTPAYTWNTRVEVSNNSTVDQLFTRNTINLSRVK